MKGYVVTVEFEIAAGKFASFMPLMLENAAASRREPGCHRFDVCTPHDRANVVFLYEIYADEAAFQAHLQASHFKAFATATGDMIVGRKLTVCDWLD
jgi:quinol monooxygenase YgiN